jgi:hypothetical protein
MGMYGCLLQVRISDHMQQMVIGYILTWVGPGHPIIVGDGRHFTTEDGFTKVVMDGCGYLATNGHPPGLAGEAIMIIMVGLL